MIHNLLGVFCPFWSDEGPHFVLPHFQGIMKTLGANASILDLNIEAARRLKSDWLGLSTNKDGIWSNPDAIAQRMKEAKVFEILKAAIIDRRPSWVVFLSVNIASQHVARFLMREIRNAFPDSGIHIAVGGPICFHLENPRAVFPEADLVWSGTLETALPRLFDRSAFEAIQNFSMPRFKPDFTGIDMTKYSKPERLPYLLNYGCHFRCHFCHEGAQYSHEIMRPVKGLTEELRTIISKRPCMRYIRFNDGSLNSHNGQFLKLLDELCDGDLFWGCNITPTKSIDSKIARKMAAAGCMGVNIGVESGSTAVRLLMKKPIPLIDIVESCIRDVNAAGLDVSINLMVGYPGETEKHTKETLAFLDRMGNYLTDVRVGKTAIYAGTPLFEQVKELGIVLNGDIKNEFFFNFWALADGSNTPAVREDRFLRIESHLSHLGFNNASSKYAEDPGRRSLRRLGICVG